MKIHAWGDVFFCYCKLKWWCLISKNSHLHKTNHSHGLTGCIVIDVFIPGRSMALGMAMLVSAFRSRLKYFSTFAIPAGWILLTYEVIPDFSCGVTSRWRFSAFLKCFDNYWINCPENRFPWFLTPVPSPACQSLNLYSKIPNGLSENSIQTIMFPRGWILITFAIPQLLL